MAAHMSLTAALGHACGIDFKAAEHLKKHPEFAWQKELPARHAVARVDDVQRKSRFVSGGRAVLSSGIFCVNCCLTVASPYSQPSHDREGADSPHVSNCLTVMAR